MSQARRMNDYTQMGAKFGDDKYIKVKAHVYVPDGDAGTECASCFQIKRASVKARGPATVPFRTAVIFMACLITVCAFTIGFKLHNRKVLAQDISAMQAAMNATRQEIADLTLQVEEARDSSRVCYIAVNELGMIAAEDASTRFIYVDEIERFTKADNENSMMSAAAELPLLSAQAQLTGSR